MSDSGEQNDLQKLQAELMAAILNEHLTHPHNGLTPGSTRVHVAIHTVVETQLHQGEPAATGATLHRLMKGGMSRHEAIHLIGEVVSDEVMGLLGGEGGEPFNQARFEQRLARLRPATKPRDPAEDPER